MNRHLNFFRTFSQNLSLENIEDNLSRAFVICLKNDSLLLYEFLRSVFHENDQEHIFQNLYSDITEKDSWDIDIQVDTTNIQGEFSKVFAIAMSGLPVNLANFFSHSPNDNKKHITDIFISINDIAFCIEVKRDNTDCSLQLYQQVAALLEESITPQNTFPLDYNWKRVMALVTRISGFQKMMNSTSILLEDFITLVQSHNPNWIPIAPLASLSNNIVSTHKIDQRLKAALKSIDSEEHPILEYHDRIGLQLNFGWAREILIYISEKEDGSLNLNFGIWPGNTKGQGTQVLNLLNKHKNWSLPHHLNINSRSFDVDSGYQLKFCHFNKYICSINLSQEEIKEGKELISGDVHWNHTGKYIREEWGQLAQFLEDYTIDGYDWKAAMKWKDNFENTNRNYLTISAGYFLETVVPLSYLQQIDTTIDNIEPLANFILEIKEQYKNLFK
ncbi:hypothetical protein H0I23_05195 [Cellulophaga sp. HaHaR_3_176]|uniref:hypothetical protein n=1 Tax=Cellulophaga sp. HaHaR_3_176 TaxID=1942464 RepID=UPI001C1FA9E8|nr:hypothetical protein [Cellulophaga sp. HaHaR_3_176]QWX85033.1 hypothetical protein H0I23_05195 [Cellulophaga sp. HaHaR_3_176]